MIRCDLVWLEETEEHDLGGITVLAVPRIGETLIFNKPYKGERSWHVVDVLYWVNNAHRDAVYQKALIYVEPRDTALFREAGPERPSRQTWVLKGVEGRDDPLVEIIDK